MLTLTLPYPCSANRYWATRVITPKGTKTPMAMTYVTPAAKAYKEQVGWLAKAAGVRAPFPGRVSVDVKLYPNRPQDFKKRQRDLGNGWDDTVMCMDLDNANKVLLDALKGVVIVDDKWVRRLTSERMEPDGEARVVITITPLHVEQPQGALELTP